MKHQENEEHESERNRSQRFAQSRCQMSAISNRRISGSRRPTRRRSSLVGPDELDCTRLGWLNEMWSLGGRRYLDVVTLHSYEGKFAPEAFEGSLMNMNTFMEANGGRG